MMESAILLTRRTISRPLAGRMILSTGQLILNLDVTNVTHFRVMSQHVGHDLRAPGGR